MPFFQMKPWRLREAESFAQGRTAFKLAELGFESRGEGQTLFTLQVSTLFGERENDKNVTRFTQCPAGAVLIADCPQACLLGGSSKRGSGVIPQESPQQDPRSALAMAEGLGGSRGGHDLSPR